MTRFSRTAAFALLSWIAAACGDDDRNGGAGASGAAASGGFGGSGAFGGVGGTGATSGNGGVGGNGCPSANASAARVKPTVMLVVDGSRSMEDAYGNNDSRWTALTAALVDNQVGIVPQLDEAVEFGLAVFSTDPTCPFPLPRIAPMLNNGDAIAATLSSDNPPGRFTPTGPALDAVFESMPNVQQVLDQDLGPQIVVLATDGEPNSCDSTDRDFDSAIAAAEKGRDKGIDMYVISLADTTGEFAAHLQEMANIGAGLDRAATPGAELYVPTNPTELAATLQSIIGGAVGCDVVLNGSVSPGFECAGSATLNSEPLTCDDPNGWTLIDPSHVRLLGSACDRFKADTTIQFHVQFPCNGFVPE